MSQRPHPPRARARRWSWTPLRLCPRVPCRCLPGRPLLPGPLPGVRRGFPGLCLSRTLRVSPAPSHAGLGVQPGTAPFPGQAQEPRMATATRDGPDGVGRRRQRHVGGATGTSVSPADPARRTRPRGPGKVPEQLPPRGPRRGPRGRSVAPLAPSCRARWLRGPGGPRSERPVASPACLAGEAALSEYLRVKTVTFEY